MLRAISVAITYKLLFQCGHNLMEETFLAAYGNVLEKLEHCCIIMYWCDIRSLLHQTALSVHCKKTSIDSHEWTASFS